MALSCGEEGCPCCPEESPAVGALRRWLGALAQWESYPQMLARDPVEARRTMAWALREPPEEYRRHVQACLGVAGYVPKKDEDDS